VSDYAVIALAGKQYTVRAGDSLLVDQLPHEAGDSFSPRVLMTGVSGEADLTDGGTVSARVEEHLKGPKLIAFTYRQKKDSKRKRGHRSRLSRITIESIG